MKEKIFVRNKNERSEFTNLGNTLSRIAKIRSLSNSALSRGERTRTVPSLGRGGLRAEGELLWQNGKAIAGTKRRPVKREQPSRCHEVTGEGSITFAKQTETNLTSYRPNALTTSNKLDCFARPADSGNGARNDGKTFPLSGEGARRAGEGKNLAIADRATLVRNDGKTLVPQYLSALVPSKKVAFTLAEVLITLGIIGVVAAMTIPSLVAEHKEKRTVTQVKKAYSVVSQAYLMAKAEYGDIRDWGIVSTITGKVDENGDRILDHSGSYLVANILKKYIKETGKKTHTLKQYLSLDGRPYLGSGGEYSFTDSENKIYTPDGSIIQFGYVYEDCSSDSGCGDIAIILPDKIAKTGVSVFWFYITPEAIKPCGHPEHLLTFDEYCDINNESGKGSIVQGRGCTAWVLINENMDYLHCHDKLGWDKAKSCK